MARRYVLPSTYGGPVVTLGGTDPMVRVYNPRGMVTKATSLTDPGYYALPKNMRGLSIQRGARTRYGTNDVVIGANGKPIAVLNAGGTGKTKNQLAFVDTPTGRRLVVRRGPGAAGGTAPPSGGAGSGSQADPYADYNDYPFIKNYLRGLDTGYDNFSALFGTKENPGPYTQAIGNAGSALANAYQSVAQSYQQGTGTAQAIGQTASQIAPASVASMSGGTVSAPNSTALASAQGQVAAQTAGTASSNQYKNITNTLTGTVDAGNMINKAFSYASGLLGQYAQKRNDDRLKLDQWIYSAKQTAQQAKDKMDLSLMQEDNKNLRALIVSGDKNAALSASTARTNADRAAREKIAADAQAGASARNAATNAAANARAAANAAAKALAAKEKKKNGGKAPKTVADPTTNTTMMKRLSDTWNGKIDSYGDHVDGTGYVALAPENQAQALWNWVWGNRMLFPSLVKGKTGAAAAFVQRSLPGVNIGNVSAWDAAWAYGQQHTTFK